jgi:hypothetical protein
VHAVHRALDLLDRRFLVGVFPWLRRFMWIFAALRLAPRRDTIQGVWQF